MMNQSHLDQSEIQEIVHRIVAAYSPQRIILFGSYAYGTPDEESDLDLFIIKESNERPLDRWMRVKRLVRDRYRPVAVSPLVYTPQEVQERLEMGDFFVQEILERGVVLYE